MDIRNVTQFSSFIGSTGLAGLNPVFQQVTICMGDFARHCDCHRREDKNRIYIRCNKLYLEGARLAAGPHKLAVLSKVADHQIAFYSESGQLIAIASR